LQQLHGIRTAHDYVTAEKQPADSDNSKSPQDAAIRYEPAAAVSYTSKTNQLTLHDFNFNDDYINDSHHYPNRTHQQKRLLLLVRNSTVEKRKRR
jgi:hypothetical protein